MATSPDAGQELLDRLVAEPIEGLNVEVKTWLDPALDENVAKLVKAMFALRNRNGGYLVLGFDNKTLQPDPYGFGKLPQEVYHPDVIQAIVSRYAHERFEVRVALRRRDEQDHPVIAIPPGVQVPVVVKSDLNLKADGKSLLNEGDLYFRTLATNGTASSARIKPSDYRDLLDICFDNREADIGRFLRRQLAGTDLETLRKLLAEPVVAPATGDGSSGLMHFQTNPVAVVPAVPRGHGEMRVRAEKTLERGNAAFLAAQKRHALPQDKKVYLTRLTLQVAMVASPFKPDALPTTEFMNAFWAANPQYTGWPAWLDTRSFSDPKARASVVDGAWVSYLAQFDRSFRDTLELMLYDPRGDFYARRLMQDDTADTVAPGTSLDPMLMLYRVTEFIAAGVSALRGTGWQAEDTAGFGFKWTGLSGRALRAWANPGRYVSLHEEDRSQTDQATSYVEVGLDTPHSALAPAVKQATGAMFACFNGYQPPDSVVEASVKALINRNL